MGSYCTKKWNIKNTTKIVVTGTGPFSDLKTEKHTRNKMVANGRKIRFLKNYENLKNSSHRMLHCHRPKFNLSLPFLPLKKGFVRQKIVYFCFVKKLTKKIIAKEKIFLGRYNRVYLIAIMRRLKPYFNISSLK